MASVPRRRAALAALLALPLSLSLLPGAAPATAAPQPELAEGIKVMTPASTVAARTDRRPMAGGLYDPVVRKTFISWGGYNEDNYVQEYDHRSGTWSLPKLVGAGGGDTHNYPTMVQANNGHILVVRGMHNKDLVVAESPNPHSIAGTWENRTIIEGIAATYPMPFKTANGDIYVFYRRTDYTIDNTQPVDQRPMLYVKSTDNGKTWKNSTQLTGAPYAIGSVGRADNMDEIYFGQMRYEPARGDRPERVHIVWTLAGGGPEGERHDRYHRDIHYAYFLPSNGHFYSADGQDLGVQIDNSDIQGPAKIVETPLVLPAGFKSPDYISQVGWLGDGRPFVVWMEFDPTGLIHTHSAVWVRGAWQRQELTTGVRIRELDPTGDGWKVYTTVDQKPNIGVNTLYGGMRWEAGPIIPTPKPVQRIELINNYREPARLLATGASSAREATVADGDIHVIGGIR